ncbi:HTH_48 domain-containing protein [Trichonephila clavipes]|uniref:HTH_48 domain-containing protein n=1 Tax=Trichonephila clavipes TaxID=2585209 RepID=A0A8X6T0I0_TRICX|nr:HTH_48 domain-containing protein [Trichonephila clavipes]
MCAAIENPAKCEVREVGFFGPKNSQQWISIMNCFALYGLNIISEGVVCQWIRFFKDRRTSLRNHRVGADLIKEIHMKKFVCSVISHSPNFQNNFQTFIGQFCMRQSQEHVVS